MTLAAESAIALGSPPRAASPARDRRAELIELSLVGGATLVLFPLSWWLRAYVGLDASALAVGFVMFHAAHVINDPHFCVTYLLFYEDARRRAFGADIEPAQRARWIVAGVVVPVVLVGWAIAALSLRSAQTLGWMVQLMFLLVGWHYVKQGFGVLTVLSARRDVRFSATERRTVLAHCYAAWAYAWSSPSTAAGEFVERGVVYWAVARPPWLELVAGAALAASTVALLAMLGAKWRRERKLALGPLAAFLITVWSWTIYSSIDPLVQYMIPALHSIQYLYFVGLMRRGQAREAEAASPFGPRVRTRLLVLALSAVALGWFLLRGAPAFLDGLARRDQTADALGATPFFAAFFVVINLHHYFMDNVIWRRENPDARHLRAD
ncbi:MAG: hypothetical protein M3Y87_31700 [Myxococcota bacterium]|nr:hypothetical protein [Myxococcota bacterium]